MRSQVRSQRDNALLMYHAIVPYQPLQLTGAPYRDTIAGILKIAWWLWAAWFLVALVRVVVIFEGRPRDGRLAQDILSALIYLTAAFAIIAYVFDLPFRACSPPPASLPSSLVSPSKAA
jgi:hypothetical protein